MLMPLLLRAEPAAASAMLCGLVVLHAVSTSVEGYTTCAVQVLETALAVLIFVFAGKIIAPIPA
jgi:hypothetical protein